MNEIFLWIDQVLFQTIDHHQLQLISKLLGGLIIWECVIWLQVFPQLLANEGWYSRSFFLQDQANKRFTLLRYLPGKDGYTKSLIFLAMFGGLLLVFGVLPQLAASLCFVCLISIQNRNFYALNGGDQVRRMLCLLIVFLPNDTGPAWPLILVQLFMANIYFKAFFNKLLGKKWRNGTATASAMNVRIMRRFALPEGLDTEEFHKLLTYGTLLLEGALFSLVWIEALRPYVVLLGVFMHIMMGIFFRLSLFQTSMIVGLISFL
ncbi:MAG: hypothetical protein AAFY71_11430 [Bacteroidota bacterium]